MTTRYRIRCALGRLFCTPRLGPWINITWDKVVPPRMPWPVLLVNMDDLRRNVRGRRVINTLLGTTSWEWSGPYSIRARYASDHQQN